MALTTEEVDISNQSLGKIGATRFTFGDTTSNQSVQSLLHFDQTRDAMLRSFDWPFAKTRLRLVSAWLTLTVYTTDQYVWQASLLYKCAVAHTSGTFADDLTSVYWVLISTVSAWTTATDYVVGGFVVNDAVYYICTTAHKSGDEDDEPGDTDEVWKDYWDVRTQKPTNIFGYNYDEPAKSLRLVKNVFDEAGNWTWNWHDNHHHHWEFETGTILTDDVEIDIVYIDQIDTTTKWDSLFMELFIAGLALKLLGPLSGMGAASQIFRKELLLEYRLLNMQARSVAKQEQDNSGDNSWNNARYR